MCNKAYGAGLIAAKNAALIDSEAPRREYLFPLPKWASETILSNLRDARDAPVATLYFNIIVLALPAVTLLYAAPACHTLGAVYLVSLYALFLARFLVALLHITEHRPLFRQGKSHETCASYAFSDFRLRIGCCEPGRAGLCNAVIPLQAMLCLIL